MAQMTSSPSTRHPPSVVTALCDGLMLQWVVDPGNTPSAAETVDALAALAPPLAS